MQRFRFGLITLSVLLFLVLTGTTKAQSTISIDFVGTGTAMAATEQAGVVPKTNWNNVVPVSGSALALVDENGKATTATLTWKCANGWKSSGANTAGNMRMMQGYCDDGDRSTSTATVAGLPANSSGYVVYVYGQGSGAASQANTASYQIGTTAVSVGWDANVVFSGTFVSANSTGAGNYSTFALTGTGFTLSAIPKTVTSGNNIRAPIAGLQIVPNAPPPPAAAPLAAMGSVPVTLSSTTPKAVIYYTTDGSTPTTSSNQYIAPIQVSQTETINSIAVAPGFTQSAMDTVTITISAGSQSTSQQFSISISSATSPLTITTTTLPGGTVGVTYSAQLAATGGKAPYTWTVTTGQLPAGLVLATTGLISGVPTAESSPSFTVMVTDSSGLTAKKSFGNGRRR